MLCLRAGVRTLCIFAALAAAVLPARAQAGWEVLDGSPYTGRHNDVYFVTPDRGWIVNGNGEIYRTDDGGSTWTRQLAVENGHFRSVGFVDANVGFAGSVGLGEFGSRDANVLYRTDDGGAHWHPVEDIAGDAPAGLCGMHVVNDSVVVAVGRVRGPATFVRTTDGGRTWTARDMGAHAAGLIDVYFPHPDSGFAVGLTSRDHEASSCVVLATDDGGATWTERYRTERKGEWCWKMSWPSRRVGYASLQRNSASPIYFLKTTDGGRTWSDELFREAYYFVQGIGFVTETQGWIGGNSTQLVYETTDGGATWQAEAMRPRLNRFRFLGDSLGYAVGRKVHKLTAGAATAHEPSAVPPEADLTVRASPNPFTESVVIEARLPTTGSVRMTVFDLLGRRVATLHLGEQPAGPVRVRWNGISDDGRRVAAGRYLVEIRTGGHRATRQLTRVR